MAGSSGAGSSGIVRRLAPLAGVLAAGVLAAGVLALAGPAVAQMPPSPAAQAPAKPAAKPTPKKTFQREALASAGSRLETADRKSVV